MLRSNRLVIAFSALAFTAVAAPAFAQKAPAPARKPAASPAESAADYEKELNALVGIQGGLTADDAAARAAKESPDAQRADLPE